MRGQLDRRERVSAKVKKILICSRGPAEYKLGGLQNFDQDGVASSIFGLVDVHSITF
jgi:hypothetical protein